MKARSGSRTISLLTCNLGCRWRQVISFTHRPVYPPGIEARYTFSRRLGGSAKRSGQLEEEKNSCPRSHYSDCAINFMEDNIKVAMRSKA